MKQEQSIIETGSFQALEAELVALRRERLLIGKITNTVDLANLLDVLAFEIEAVGDFDGYMVNIVDKRHENLVCEKVKLPASFDAMQRTYQKFRFPMDLLDANVASYSQRATIFVDKDNVGGFEGDTRLRFERWLLESLVVIPILSEEASEEPLGTVMLYRQTGSISPVWVAAIEQLLLLFRRQIKLAFLYNEVCEHEREVQLITEEQQRFLQFVSRINTLNSSEKIYDTISAEFLRRFPFDLFAVLVREGEELVPKKFKVINDKFDASCHALEEYFRDRSYQLGIADGASVTCFMQNKSLLVPDAMKVLHLPMSEKDKQGLKCMKTPHTFLLVPVRRAEEAVGLIWLVSLGRPVHFSDAQLKLVELLASFIGTALANAELYTLAQEQKQKIEMLNFSLKLKVEELRDLSAKDRLTGLNNFGFFEEELGRRMHEYGRESAQKQLSLVILDVDHFKKFNDTYGHLTGNAVLQEVAQRTSRLARKMDIVCRYGGEEFAILLPKCDLEGARLFAERVRRDIEGRPFVVEDAEVSITVSLGCAQFDGEEEGNKLVQRADQALYRAKSNGRNRVEVAMGAVLSGAETP